MKLDLCKHDQVIQTCQRCVLERERDEWKARAEKAEAEIDGMKVEWYSMCNGRLAAEASAARMRAALEHFSKATEATPIGAENPSKGQSIYNWRKSFVRELEPAFASDSGAELLAWCRLADERLREYLPEWSKLLADAKRLGIEP